MFFFFFFFFLYIPFQVSIVLSNHESGENVLGHSQRCDLILVQVCIFSVRWTACVPVQRRRCDGNELGSRLSPSPPRCCLEVLYSSAEPTSPCFTLTAGAGGGVSFCRFAFMFSLSCALRGSALTLVILLTQTFCLVLCLPFCNAGNPSASLGVNGKSAFSGDSHFFLCFLI